MTRLITMLLFVLMLTLISATGCEDDVQKPNDDISDVDRDIARDAIKHESGVPREIDWLDMIPPDELKAIEKMQMIDHSGGMMAQIFTSANTVPTMDGVRGKLPGYVVPIEGDSSGKVTEFFFVPYFGACTHMPPPPPNQIVHVKTSEPVDPGEYWDAFWMTGTLRASLTENAMAKSAYSFELESLEKYEYER